MSDDAATTDDTGDLETLPWSIQRRINPHLLPYMRVLPEAMLLTFHEALVTGLQTVLEPEWIAAYLEGPPDAEPVEEELSFSEEPKTALGALRQTLRLARFMSFLREQLGAGRDPPEEVALLELDAQSALWRVLRGLRLPSGRDAETCRRELPRILDIMAAALYGGLVAGMGQLTFEELGQVHAYTWAFMVFKRVCGRMSARDVTTFFRYFVEEAEILDAAERMGIPIETERLHVVGFLERLGPAVEQESEVFVPRGVLPDVQDPPHGTTTSAIRGYLPCASSPDAVARWRSRETEQRRTHCRPGRTGAPLHRHPWS